LVKEKTLAERGLDDPRWRQVMSSTEPPVEEVLAVVPTYVHGID
jgi:hypothetical protein